MRTRDIVFHRETEVYFWILSLDSYGARLAGKDGFVLYIGLQQLKDDFEVKGNLDEMVPDFTKEH